MKSLLVPIDHNPAAYPVLEMAALVARRFGSFIEGVPSIQDMPIVVTEVGGTWPFADEHREKDRMSGAKQLFENFMTSNGIPGSGPAPNWRWHGERAIPDSQIGAAGRVFDAIVVGRPDPNGAYPRNTTFEAALFESGRPLILAPPNAPASIGTEIVVHWNGSTETARAIGAALPFLKEANRVSVLAVEGAMADGPSGGELVSRLARHGIKVEYVVKPGSTRTSGELILDHAAAVGADLIIKGAYTQSRLRQMIFGGATSHVLANASIPVLMAH